MQGWRAALVKVHRWLGLTAGMLLLLNALTGALMLAARPLDHALNPQLFRVAPSSQPAALEPVRQALQAEFGAQAGFTLRPPRAPEDSLWVFVRSPTWEGQVYFDPASGRRLGARGEHEGFASALFEFHSALLLGERGKAILAFNVLTMLAMLCTGLVLWWPRRRAGAFGVELRRGLPRALFDLHRVGGALLGAWVLVCVASGAWMAWRPISQWVTQAAGQKATTPPAATAAVGEALPLDALVANADAALPGGIVGYVQLPARANAPVRVRKKLADDPHPNGLSSVWLHPRSGAVLRVDRWQDLDVGARQFTWIYPLHSGQLGGALGVAATAIGGLLLAGYGISGTWLWWLRRTRRNVQAKNARSAGGTSADSYRNEGKPQ